jgi:light-harvesting complex 1 beta chain
MRLSRTGLRFLKHALLARWSRADATCWYPHWEGGDTQMATSDNDMVPGKWKVLFNNEEWLVHDIIVKTTYGYGIVATIAHLLVWFWRPWVGF